MDLELDADELELRDAARSFLESACPPKLVRAVFEGNGADEVDGLWASMVELGWPGLAAAEDHGGLGQGFIAEAVLVSELGRVVAPGPFLGTVTQFVPLLTQSKAGGDVLTRAVAGEVTGAVAYTGVTASPASSGGWVLHGTASHVVDGASADHLGVVAHLENGSGAGAFLLPRKQVTAERLDVIDPTIELANVRLDAAAVASDQVLLDPGDRASSVAIERARRHATAAMALSCVASCRAIFQTTVDYAKQRQQFGRPIGSFQAIKHRLADLFLAVERADALAWFAACTIAEDDERAPVAVAMAKAAAGDCQQLATRDGLQLHGGVGFTWEHDLHFLLKRAVTTARLCGDAPHHRAELAQLLGLAA
jgi:alkylation response protein AidB-like acyl-CoA dehydrogenase